MNEGPILRLFEVQAKPGCADALLKKFETTSAEVVRGEPGNLGYFFGRAMAGAEDQVVFCSLWESLTAIQDRFGADWHLSFLPPGYEDLIEHCAVRHIDARGGWQVSPSD